MVRYAHNRAPLAQVVEQLTLNQRVRGSSPWRRTNCAWSSRSSSSCGARSRSAFGVVQLEIAVINAVRRRGQQEKFRRRGHMGDPLCRGHLPAGPK